jgi:hypothetical protein
MPFADFVPRIAAFPYIDIFCRQTRYVPPTPTGRRQLQVQVQVGSRHIVTLQKRGRSKVLRRKCCLHGFLQKVASLVYRSVTRVAECARLTLFSALFNAFPVMSQNPSSSTNSIQTGANTTQAIHSGRLSILQVQQQTLLWVPFSNRQGTGWLIYILTQLGLLNPWVYPMLHKFSLHQSILKPHAASHHLSTLMLLACPKDRHSLHQLEVMLGIF